MRYGALTGATLTAALGLASAAETYRGIDIAPEHRCAPYDRGDYRYSQSLEPRIVASLGKVYGPYTAPVSATRPRRTLSTWWQPRRRTTAACVRRLAR